MDVLVEISQSLYDAASTSSKIGSRTISQQIEYWAVIGRCVLDNPELPVEFICDILNARRDDQSQPELFIELSK